MMRQPVSLRPPRSFRNLPFMDFFDEEFRGDDIVEGTEDDVRKEDWKWPCFDEWFDPRAGKKVRKPKDESVQKNNAIPFKVIYSLEHKDFYTTFVELNSQPLIKTLRGILPDKSEILRDTPKVEARDLFHVMEKLCDVASTYASDPTSESTMETEGASDLEIERIHLNHLIRFLEREYSQESKSRDRMLVQRVVSFDMLWVFYTTDLDVWYRCDMSGQQIGGVISSVLERVEPSPSGQDFQKVFYVYIKVIDCDGEGFKRCTVTRKIEYFKGERSFSDLPIVPFKFSRSQTVLENTIAENGKRFFELALGSHFMNYEGPLLRWRMKNNSWKLEKSRANGRVMIDLQSFATMNPSYPMGNASPPNKCDVELFDEEEVYLDEEQIHQKANQSLAPAVVYGFSFALKEWGQFEVSKFSNIRFDTDAFSNLVMPQDKKEMLEGLVRQYSGQTNKTDGDELVLKPLDPITHKGNGCIFLCYGPPGTGKTLTAESVAEFLKRPLWMLSVHELGMKPGELDQQLVKILDIAYTWKAILLLDEADIYLEKRTTADLKRNAMVGVFLRRLEYYQGILFLTTNRVTTFDDAICSRINMFFHYPKFNPEERHKVWTNFIRNANLPLNADDFNDYELNGREIRNVLHTAQTLAKSQGQAFTADHVIKVIKTVQGFQREMEEIRKNHGE